MPKHNLITIILFALASNACMTEADKLVFQDVFHNTSTSEQTAELSPAAAEPEQATAEQEIAPADIDEEPAKAADASEPELEKNIGGVEAS